jgi:hypothetical protein
MFICVVIGMCPIRGSVKLSTLKRLATGAACLEAPPSAEGDPPAGRFVIVDEVEEAGRAPAFDLGAESFLNQSPNDDLDFAGGALAMVFSVQRVVVGGAVGPVP